jgi:hypothetical protein
LTDLQASVSKRKEKLKNSPARALPEIGGQIQKLAGSLNKNKIAFTFNREIGRYASFQVEKRIS